MMSGKKAAHLCAAFAFLASVLAGCAQLPWQSPQEVAARLAASAGFQQQTINTGDFRLTSFLRVNVTAAAPPESLTVYIEGDGAAWHSPILPPRDPTPGNPIALKLASRDPAAAVAYLARPCQYLSNAELAHCDYRYWTSARYAPEVLRSMNQAIEFLRRNSGASRLRLVGFSGGGVIAAALAAERLDVGEVVAIAAPLDLHLWTDFHKITPLAFAPNPIKALAERPDVELRFFAGSADNTVPSGYVDNLRKQMPFARFHTIASYTHECCWTEQWPALLQTDRTPRP